MADLNTTLIAVISAVGCILLVCTIVLCCFLYIFWRRQHGDSSSAPTDKSNSSSGNSKRPLKTTASSADRDHDLHDTNDAITLGTLNIDAKQQQPTSQAPSTALQLSHSGSVVHFTPNDDITSTSHTGTGTAAAEKYDFLVHPEFDYASAPSTNSGNGSNQRLPPAYARSPVTTAASSTAVRAQQLTKLQLQRRRIQAIVKHAKNKLHLIDASHIAFEYEIGRGKFGKVFRALWTDSYTKRQRSVAVKWFKQDEVDEEVFEDFVKEISVAAHLPSHENVLTIYGFCIQPYALVTEFVNGGSVEMVVSTRHPDSIRQQLCIGDVVQLLIDAANGISHLHTMGIIHRDVASRNLLVHNDPDAPPSSSHAHSRSRSSQPQSKSKPRARPRRRVLVCDFGLSRITTHPDQDNHTNSHVGPLKWMSPESIKLQVYNSKTDVYSFGVTMWEVLCGCPPYPNTKVLSLAVEVISRQIRPLILPWFPRPLSVLMQRCWQELPEFRPTFEDIKNELMLFQRQLGETRHLNTALTQMAVTPGVQFKEKLRTLPQLVSEYLKADGSDVWETLASTKLQSVIDDYEKRRPPNQNMYTLTHTQHNNDMNLNPNQGQNQAHNHNVSVVQLQSSPTTPVVRTVSVADVDADVDADGDPGEPGVDLVIDVGDDEDEEEEQGHVVGNGNANPGSAVVSRRTSRSLLPQLLNTESMSIQTSTTHHAMNLTQTVHAGDAELQLQQQQPRLNHQHDVSFSVHQDASHEKILDASEQQTSADPYDDDSVHI